MRKCSRSKSKILLLTQCCCYLATISCLSIFSVIVARKVLEFDLFNTLMTVFVWTFGLSAMITIMGCFCMEASRQKIYTHQELLTIEPAIDLASIPGPVATDKYPHVLTIPENGKVNSHIIELSSDSPCLKLIR